MKSIRLSLVIYFLALLTVALGTASLLAYRAAQKALEEKQEAAKLRIQSQFVERCDKEKDRLDQSLLHQAETLAQLASIQIDWDRVGFPYSWGWAHRSRRGAPPLSRVDPNYHLVVGAIGAQHAPFGTFTTLGWFAETNRELSSPEWLKNLRGEVRIEENQLHQNVDENVAEYYQLDASWAWDATYRSKSLGERAFPFNPDAFPTDHVFHHEIGDYQLDADTTVRRAILKVSGAKVTAPELRPPPPPPGQRPASPPPPGNLAVPPDRRQRPPSIYIQCAFNVNKRETAIRDFEELRDNDLIQVDLDNKASLASLRNSLLGMSAIIFIATVAGSILLVRLGLLPLRRLSDAVSRVSAKDFRLQFDEPRLPKELQPIVERLIETLDQLKRAFSREKKATADISHELRTPLAALLTTTELALRKQRSADEYREFLQDCQLSGKQMNQAVERLLTLARLDAGVEVVRPRDVDAAQLAEQCAAVVRPLAEARGLHLNVHRDGNAHVNADPDKLREVLTNLLHNAIQYNRPDGDIDVNVERENGHLNLEVSDTGIGIAPEAREHIFERFFRADSSRGTDGLHAGLGLAIVKEYVGLMGGTIAVESAEGRGTTFRVQLPAHS